MGFYRTKELFGGVRGRLGLRVVRFLPRGAGGAEPDLADLDQRHGLSMTLALGVPGLRPVPEDLDLLALMLAEELRLDRRLRDVLADMALAVVVHHEERRERDAVAVVSAEELHLEHVSRLPLVLLSATLDHGVHGALRCLVPRRRRQMSCVTSMPRPSQVGQTSEKDSSSPAETRLRVTSRSPSGPMSKTWDRVLS